MAIPDTINGMTSGTWHELLDHQTCTQKVHCQHTSRLRLPRQSRRSLQIALTCVLQQVNTLRLNYDLESTALLQ